VAQFLTLVPEVLSVADMVPEPLVIGQLRVVADEVCRKTEVWKSTVEVTTVEGRLDYALPDVAGDPGTVQETGIPYRLHQASFEATQLRLATALQIAGWKPDWKNPGEQFRGTPLYAVQGITAQTVTLYPAPNGNEADKTARFTVSVIPVMGAMGLPAAVMGEVDDTLVHGCLQRLLAMPRRPWSNRASSQYYAEQYRFKRNAVRVRASHDFTHGPLVAQLRPWV